MVHHPEVNAPRLAGKSMAPDVTVVCWPSRSFSASQDGAGCSGAVLGNVIINIHVLEHRSSPRIPAHIFQPLSLETPRTDRPTRTKAKIASQMNLATAGDPALQFGCFQEGEYQSLPN